MLFSEGVAFYSAAVAIFLNVLLMPVVILCSSNKIGSYKFLLFIYTFDCALFAIIQLFFLPTFYASGTMFLFYSTKPFEFANRTFPTFGIIGLCTCYVNITVIVCLSFLYRYAVVCRKPLLAFFKPENRLHITLVVSFLIHVWPVSTDYFISPMFNPNLDSFVETEMKVALNRSVVNTAYCGGPKQINGSYNIPLIASKFSYLFLCLISLIINGVCSVAIIQQMKYIANMSRKQHNMQYKLLILLICQTASPFLFFSVPYGITMISFFFDSDIWNIGDLFGTVCCFGLILDPLMIVFIMSDYRKALFRLFDVRRPTVYLYSNSSQKIFFSK